MQCNGLKVAVLLVIALATAGHLLAIDRAGRPNIVLRWRSRGPKPLL